MGGTAITIKGEQFMSGIKLYIDGREIENITRISETELKAVAPPNIKEGSKDVKIVNPDRGDIFTETDLLIREANRSYLI